MHRAMIHVDIFGILRKKWSKRTMGTESPQQTLVANTNPLVFSAMMPVIMELTIPVTMMNVTQIPEK